MYCVEGIVNMAALTEQQAEFLQEIEADEPSEKACDELYSVLSEFNYTSTLLTQLAIHHREEFGDITGCSILLEAARLMAEHEARTI